MRNRVNHIYVAPVLGVGEQLQKKGTEMIGKLAELTKVVKFRLDAGDIHMEATNSRMLLASLKFIDCPIWMIYDPQ